MHTPLRFSEVATKADAAPGYYEIRTTNGIPVKAGVAKNLRKRLLQHGSSRQNGLKGAGTVWLNPSGVISKRSILAKHLYFDASIAPDYDLCSESGRQAFLEECYRILIRRMPRDDARELERGRKKSACAVTSAESSSVERQVPIDL